MAKPKPFPDLQFGLFETGSHYSVPVGLELVNQEALKLRNWPSSATSMLELKVYATMPHQPWLYFADIEGYTDFRTLPGKVEIWVWLATVRGLVWPSL